MMEYCYLYLSEGGQHYLSPLTFLSHFFPFGLCERFSLLISLTFFVKIDNLAFYVPIKPTA